MDASRNGRHVLALVPSAVGYTSAATNDTRKIPLQVRISKDEKGGGFDMGSAGIISVFTIFLTAIAVDPATVSEASQPATARHKEQLHNVK